MVAYVPLPQRKWEEVWSPDSRFWCEQVIVHLLRKVGDNPGLYEDDIYRLMIRLPSDWSQRPSWNRLSDGTKATLISMCITHLIRTKRIYAVPELTQVTGRRCFRLKNPLDAIVEALE